MQAELKTPTSPIMNTVSLSKAVRRNMGPGMAQADRIFYREPEQSHVISERYFPSPETLLLLAQSKHQSPVKTYGATGYHRD